MTGPGSVLVSDSCMSCERWEKPHPCTLSGKPRMFSPIVLWALGGFQTPRTGGGEGAALLFPFVLKQEVDYQSPVRLGVDLEDSEAEADTVLNLLRSHFLHSSNILPALMFDFALLSFCLTTIFNTPALLHTHT